MRNSDSPRQLPKRQPFTIPQRQPPPHLSTSFHPSQAAANFRRGKMGFAERLRQTGSDFVTRLNNLLADQLA